MIQKNHGARMSDDNGETWVSISRNYASQEGRFFHIIKNSAECLKCKCIIESKHRHDFVTCSCGDISVDGGKDYIKRSFSTDAEYIDHGKYEKFSKEELEKSISIWEMELNSKHCLSHKMYEDSMEAAKHFMNLWYPENI